MHVQDVVAVAGGDVGRVLVALHDVEPHALLRERKVLDHETSADLSAGKDINNIHQFRGTEGIKVVTSQYQIFLGDTLIYHSLLKEI